MGMPCDLSSLITIANKHSIPLIEDAACAIGSEILWDGKWERIGKPHGDAACFSFHPRKVISTGDGGMITTRHKLWDEKFRLLRQHGMSVSDSVRHSSPKVVYETYSEPGFNYRMTDIQAAVGREQLKRLDAIIARRRDLARAYNRYLRAIPELTVPCEPDWVRSNWQSYCVGLPKGCNQREIMQALLDRGIATRRGIMCAHREPAYEKQRWRLSSPLSNSENAQERSILLPLYTQMVQADQERIALALQEILSREYVS
jgi:dTDP-4-amino-4,6-dideoxygalactose transaminase